MYDELPRFGWRTGFRNYKGEAWTPVMRFVDTEIGFMSPFLVVCDVVCAIVFFFCLCEKSLRCFLVSEVYWRVGCVDLLHLERKVQYAPYSGEIVKYFLSISTAAAAVEFLLTTKSLSNFYGGAAVDKYYVFPLIPPTFTCHRTVTHHSNNYLQQQR